MSTENYMGPVGECAQHLSSGNHVPWGNGCKVCKEQWRIRHEKERVTYEKRRIKEGEIWKAGVKNHWCIEKLCALFGLKPSQVNYYHASYKRHMRKEQDLWPIFVGH